MISIAHDPLNVSDGYIYGGQLAGMLCGGSVSMQCMSSGIRRILESCKYLKACNACEECLACVVMKPCGPRAP
jgi:hypothetical protein